MIGRMASVGIGRRDLDHGAHRQRGFRELAKVMGAAVGQVEAFFVDNVIETGRQVLQFDGLSVAAACDDDVEMGAAAVTAPAYHSSVERSIGGRTGWVCGARGT